MINLTPHDINVLTKDGIVTFPKSGIIARVSEKSTIVGKCKFTGVDIVQKEYTEVENLPEEGHFLVSAMVLQAAKKKEGLFLYAPDSGSSAIRDEKGQIKAVVSLVVKES